MIIFKKENIGLVLSYYAKDLRDRLDSNWINADFTAGETQYTTSSGDRIIRTVESGTPTPEEVKSIIGMLPPRLMFFVVNPVEHYLRASKSRTPESQRDIADQVDAWYRWEDGPDEAFKAEGLLFTLGHQPDRYNGSEYTQEQIQHAYEMAREDCEYFGYDLEETARKYSVQL